MTCRPHELASYASIASQTRGRLVEEHVCPHRSSFARDRDRIIHSTAFRRLSYKTQVFIYHEGDHYRGRLTHSLEVAQISRSLARQLNIDEDLCEAMALAHDLGHAPFGHAGERAMAHALKAFGGFDHNLQTLRILTELEKRYPQFDGLNLSFETLEGLIKHNGPLMDKSGALLAKDPSHEMVQAVLGFEHTYGFGLHLYASLEGQVAALADDIAYNNHDIDDGLRAGLIKIDDLRDVPFVWEVIGQIRAEHENIADERLVFELNRRLITLMIGDVREETTRRLGALAPASCEDIRRAGQTIASFSKEFSMHFKNLQDFLRERVYQNERMKGIMADAESVTSDIVLYFLKNPQCLPKEWLCESDVAKRDECAVSIKDYVAGMTDRYILDLHRSLFDATPKLR